MYDRKVVINSVNVLQGRSLLSFISMRHNILYTDTTYFTLFECQATILALKIQRTSV